MFSYNIKITNVPNSFYNTSKIPRFLISPSLLPPPPTQPMSLYSDDEDNNTITTNGGDDSPNHDKKASNWQRMKWTDDMVRLLISLVVSIDTSGRNQGSVMQKKGKWKLVSKLMLREGCFVSPQQCEDKFNDLNKRFKRLNEILGSGTSCQVVENPTLLDSLTHVSQKAKDDVRRILSSKHLFYREMCAYHNGQTVGDENNQILKCDEEEEEEEDDDDDDDDDDDYNVVVQDSTKTVCEKRGWIRKRILKLQRERVGIQLEAFELEKRRMKWKRFCHKKDWELESLRMKNEKLCLENERMMLEMRHKEVELDFVRPGEMSERFGNHMEGENGVGKIQ